MSGIYIHVPFCYKRCHYCDFYTTLHLDKRISFTNAIIKELIWRKDFLGGEKVDSIYLGGGTPSVLSIDNIESILESIDKNYSLTNDIEITIEANPDDMDREYAEALFKSRINRLSIGIQSFNDKELRGLNRRHDAEQAVKAVDNAILVGFKQISIDLIYGLPQQTLEGWRNNIHIASKMPVEHISAYHLTYEKGTNFYKWMKEGKLKEAEEGVSLEMFKIAVNSLKKEGFEHYEISNFARNNKYSRHNTKYWFGEKYLGVGPSAHSYNGHMRFWNVSDLDSWINSYNNNTGKLHSENIDKETKRNEMIMTRLRTKWGIHKSDFTKEFGFEEWNRLLDLANPYFLNDFIELNKERLLITDKGKFLSDGIISQLFIVR